MNKSLTDHRHMFMFLFIISDYWDETTRGRRVPIKRSLLYYIFYREPPSV